MFLLRCCGGSSHDSGSGGGSGSSNLGSGTWGLAFNPHPKLSLLGPVSHMDVCPYIGL